MHDLDERKTHTFTLADLPKNIKLFGFMTGKTEKPAAPEIPADIRASELMGDIYDAMRNSGYESDDMPLLLTRLLFCLFAEDTGIFEQNIFGDYLQNHTTEDGGALGAQLADIFQTLNTAPANRQTTINKDLHQFPHVNGDLFATAIKIANFDGATRAALLRACAFDWSAISPAIFGALFQSVRDSKRRRGGGEHYTSEHNILKVIRPLFLDELDAEFRNSENRPRALKALHNKIAALTFFDLACGCGNFLIVAYRELRLLEMEILNRLYPRGKGGNRDGIVNIADLCRINVDAFYGVEIDDFAARIAQVALWLADHQMNNKMSALLGKEFRRIPLTTAPHIVCGNALTIDWHTVVAPDKLSYILGNPPFVGKQYRTPQQRREMNLIFGDAPRTHLLDYVAAWYVKAAHYICKKPIRCAFVSTNSLTQGNQVASLWSFLYAKNIKIHFAHRTFVWNNEAGGKAHVHVVIIGFGNTDINNKTIYDYPDGRGEPRATAATNINAYLADAANILIQETAKPLCEAPELMFGNMPNDGGHLLLSNEEKKELIRQTPQAAAFIRPAISAQYFLHNKRRWCLWLTAAEPSAFRKIKPIMERINKVKSYRDASKRSVTKISAETPHLFHEIRQPDDKYILIPLHTSENRTYIPIDFMPRKYIALAGCAMMPKGNLYHFGIVTSLMHMAWMRAVAGRLESRYRYSNNLVYNTFPWPQNITAAKKQKIKECARAILDARKNHKKSTLADMYSLMPKDLITAHRALDRAVDRAYRTRPFADERVRIEYLFTEYARLSTPAIPPPPKQRKI